MNDNYINNAIKRLKDVYGIYIIASYPDKRGVYNNLFNDIRHELEELAKAKDIEIENLRSLIDDLNESLDNYE